MGLFDDILKGLPVNPLLREKIADVEAKYAASETENAGLKDDLREAKMLIAELKQQVKELTHKDDPDDVEIAILKAFAVSNAPYKSVVARAFPDLQNARFEYYTQKLVDDNYLRMGGIDRQHGPAYVATQAARKLLMDKNLI